MDSTDDFTNVSDTESEIFQSTYSENSSSSSKLEEAIGEKRKSADSVEEKIPSKKLCKDDTTIFTNPNSTVSDDNITNYFFESTEDDAVSTEQSYESADDTILNLTPFARKNINTLDYKNTTNKKLIVNDSDDEYGTPVMKFPERMKQLKRIKKTDLTLSDDDELKNNFHAFFENMKNQNISETASKMTMADTKSSTPSFGMSKVVSAVDTSGTKWGVNKMEINQSLSPKRNVVENLFETSVISKMTMADTKSSTPSFSMSKVVSAMDTSSAKWDINKMEINQSLSPNQSLKRNVVENLFTVDETPFVNQNQDLNKGKHIDKYFTSLGVKPITIKSNNENVDIKTEEIDQKFLDYMDTNEPFAEDSVISDSNLIPNSEEEIFNVSKCDKMILVSDDYQFAKTATYSHSSTLVEQDSQNSIIPDFSKFSVGGCGLSITEQQSEETIRLQNTRDQIIASSEEQSNSNYSSETHYIDVNQPSSLDDYYSTTKTSVISNVGVDNQNQNSQNSTLPNFRKFSVGDCGFLIAEQQPTETIRLHNTRDQIIARSDEQSNSNSSSETHYIDVDQPSSLKYYYSSTKTSVISNVGVDNENQNSENSNITNFRKFSDTETEEGSKTGYSSGDTTENAEHLSGENEASKNIIEIGSREPFSSKSTTDIMQISFRNYSTVKTPTISSGQALVQSPTHFICEEQTTDIIKSQTIPKETIVINDVASNLGENKELSSTQIITLQNFPDQITAENIKQSGDKGSSEGCYMDVNVERLACENKISNIINETQTEDLVPNPLTYKTMQPLLEDSSSFTKISVIPNVDVDKQNDFIPGKQSKQNINPQNVSGQATEAAEEVSNINNDEQSENKRVRNRKKTAKRDGGLKEADFDKIRTAIHDLIEEYIKNTKLVEFTLHDVTEFITERLPNVTRFKVIHAVRVYFMSSLKCGVLKQVGQKYALRGKPLDA